MHPPSSVVAAARPEVAAVNDQIRNLMNRPSSAERTEEYVRLLTLWATATEARGTRRALG